MKFGDYKVHPLADEFPLLPKEEMKDLAEDIRTNGQKYPILLGYDGVTIVDGRNRFVACGLAKVEPEFEQIDPGMSEEDIANDIISRNLKRRQLTTGQRAMVALSYEQHLAVLAKGRQREAGRAVGKGETDKLRVDRPEASAEQRRSREKAAQTVGTSGTAVGRAKSVQKDAPDLADEVKQGKRTLDSAYKEARERKQPPTPPKQAPPNTPPPGAATAEDFKEVQAEREANKPATDYQPPENLPAVDSKRLPAYVDRTLSAVEGVQGPVKDQLLRLAGGLINIQQGDNPALAYLRCFDALVELIAVINSERNDA